jgi:hypothetical protein|tara:strand:- start:294 stop:1895 length:1602 start_codon:yes stop_codon:yes gene_type:complete
MEKLQKNTKATKHKVCILAAGVGGRNSYSKDFVKGLLPYKNKALICYIIESLPKNLEIIVAVGFKENIYREFLPMAYPNRVFTFVSVEPYQGKGSGPGYSLLCCEKYLDNPFYLIPSDAYVDPQTPLPNRDFDWIGLGSAFDDKLSSYCLAETNKKNQVIKFIDKEENPNPNLKNNVFTGIAFIHNHNNFFEGLKTKNLIKNERQVSSGFENLISKGLKAYPLISWKDLGTSLLYEHYALSDKSQNLLKPREKTFIINKKIFKYFEDQEIVAEKIIRTNQLKPLTPKIIDQGKNFFSYEMVPGHLLSEETSEPLFENFLNKCQKTLFNPIKVNKEEKENFQDQCIYFYKDLTLRRVEEYLKKYPNHSKSHKINGEDCPDFETLWSKIPWEELRQGIPSHFHGDFQPENIICSPREIKLIDWRQNFTKDTPFGDVYYDLSKLKHALIINGQMIREERYSIDILSNKVQLSYLIKSNLFNFLKILNKFSKKNDYSIKKIDLLTGIIYLRIASLYDTDYSNFLYFLGIHFLSKRLL